MLRFKCPSCSQRTITITEKIGANYKHKYGCPNCYETWGLNVFISSLMLFFSVFCSQIIFSYTDFSFLERCFIGGVIIFILLLAQPIIKK